MPTMCYVIHAVQVAHFTAVHQPATLSLDKVQGFIITQGRIGTVQLPALFKHSCVHGWPGWQPRLTLRLVKEQQLKAVSGCTHKTKCAVWLHSQQCSNAPLCGLRKRVGAEDVSRGVILHDYYRLTFNCQLTSCKQVAAAGGAERSRLQMQTKSQDRAQSFSVVRSGNCCLVFSC